MTLGTAIRVIVILSMICTVARGWAWTGISDVDLVRNAKAVVIATAIPDSLVKKREKLRDAEFDVYSVRVRVVEVLSGTVVTRTAGVVVNLVVGLVPMVTTATGAMDIVDDADMPYLLEPVVSDPCIWILFDEAGSGDELVIHHPRGIQALGRRKHLMACLGSSPPADGFVQYSQAQPREER